MFTDLQSLCAAFGLSSASGLNAYIPLLTVSIMQRSGALHLAKPYDTMGEWWCIAILVVLCIVEIVVDKVPGADHVNDVVQTFIRPTAGAILFASQAGHITSAHPSIMFGAGLLTSGSVHTVKALARPVINVTTLGIGAPIVSTIEDLVSTVLSILAILLPILTVVFMAVVGWLLYKMFRKLLWKRKQNAQLAPVRVVATPMGVPRQLAAAEPGAKNWGGGL